MDGRKSILMSGVAFYILFCVPAVSRADEADGGANTNAPEEIVVSGIRSALKAAVDEKRMATEIIDAVSAEDIGKFPDKDVADTLQRIPGISVDRSWGEGRDLFIRGTDNTMNRTELNGQTMASAYWWANDNPSRGFNYQILPSEIVKSVEVIKSPSADIDEGSIGGLVDVKTRRPLDFAAPFTFQGSAEGIYSVLPGDIDPNISAMGSWHNDARTFGILASLGYSEMHLRRDGLESFDAGQVNFHDQNGKTYNNVWVPWGGGSALFEQDNQRWTENVALEARPDDHWDIALNFLNSTQQQDNHNLNYLWLGSGNMTNGPASDNLVSNPRFIKAADGNLTLVGGTVGAPGSPGGVAYEPIYRTAYVDSKAIDFDSNYYADRWSGHVQAGYTDAQGGSSRDYHTWFQGNSDATINLGPSTDEFSFGQVNPLNPAALDLTKVEDNIRKMTDKEYYAQGDLTYEVGEGILRELKAGVKFSDETVVNTQSTFAGGYPAVPASAGILSLAQMSTGPTPQLQQATKTAGSLTQYAEFNETLANQVINFTFPEVFNPAAYFDIDEKIYAAYLRADFQYGDWKGNIGLRAVRTDQNSAAYSIDQSGNAVLGSVDTPYYDFLPNLNISYDITPDLKFRGALSEAMARNTWINISSNFVQNETVTTEASVGNPHLKPMKADQVEGGLEWYHDDASLVAGTVFYKRLNTFIYTATEPEMVGNVLYNVTGPFNYSSGTDILGFEAQVEQQLLWGFGFSLNYTYTEVDVPLIPGMPKMKFPGNSKHQGNASLYFEQGPVEARLSVNYRSDAAGALTSGGQLVTDAATRLDASASYQITDYASLFFTAVNITDAVSNTHLNYGLPYGDYETGSRYSLGARFKF
jgi:iron complex outermembrane receptor protein